MALKWKRPENVPFPSVWSRFEGRREINGKIPKFWVQDVPEERFEEAAEMMCKNFIYDEPLCKYSKIIDDEESLVEIRELWKLLVQERMALICFMENPEDPSGEPIIAGMNMTYPSSKGDDIPEYKGKKWLMVLNSVLYLCHIKDPYSLFGIDSYLSAMGLSVLPEFRGQGIGEEILKARVPMCKAVGLPATLTVFTAGVSQKLALKTGFKDVVQLSYEELEAANSQFRFPGITEHTKNIRFMYKLID